MCFHKTPQLSSIVTCIFEDRFLNPEHLPNLFLEPTVFHTLGKINRGLSFVKLENGYYDVLISKDEHIAATCSRWTL
eukprot:UN27312